MSGGAGFVIFFVSLGGVFLTIVVTALVHDFTKATDEEAFYAGAFTFVTCGVMILSSSLWYHDSITPKARMNLTPHSSKQVDKRVKLHKSRPVEALLMEMDDLVMGRKKPFVVCDAIARKYFSCTP